MDERDGSQERSCLLPGGLQSHGLNSGSNRNGFMAHDFFKVSQFVQQNLRRLSDAQSVRVGVGKRRGVWESATTFVRRRRHIISAAGAHRFAAHAQLTSSVREGQPDVDSRPRQGRRSHQGKRGNDK